MKTDRWWCYDKCIFFCLWILFLVAYNPRAADTHAYPRVIGVCVLNDVAAPVMDGTIIMTLAAVFREYTHHAGVVFRIKERIAYAGDLTAWDIDQGLYLNRLCPHSEIRIVFSNQKIMRKDMAWTEDSLLPEDTAVLGGSNNNIYGYILLYQSDLLFSLENNERESALFTVLRHELGHLFNLDHSLDANSFMYPVLASSHGLWTDKIIKELNAHKYSVRWFPYR